MSVVRWVTALRNPTFNLTGTVLASLGVVAVLLTSWMVTTSSPRSEIQVRLSDGAVWLPSNALGGVSLLDGGSGSIATSLEVAGNDDRFDVVQWGSDAIVVNQSDGTVARLDGSAWEITTGRVQFSEPGETMAVVAGHDVGWLVKSGSVSPIDLDTLDQRNPVPVGAAFGDGLVTDDGNLLFASDDPETPVRQFHIDGSPAIDVEDLRGPTALADLGSSDAAVDLDDHSVWLASQGTVCDRLPVVPGSALKAGGADEHLFVIADDGNAFLWNPRDSGCPGDDDFLTLGASTYGRPVLTFGWAVVQDIDSGEVIVVDFDALDDVKRRALEGVAPGTPVQLVAENGAVWYNDPMSARAGLINRDGTLEPISKYDESSDRGFVAAPVSDPDVEDVAVAGAQLAADELEAADTEAAQTEAQSTPPTTEPSPQNDNAAQPDPATDGSTPTTEPDASTDENEETTDPTNGGTDPDEPTDPDGETDETTPPVTQIEPPEEQGPIDIQIGATGSEVAAGGSLQFTSITTIGKPNFWELQVSPDTGRQASFETFGTFDYTFYDPGTYRVSIRACDAENNCVTETIAVTVVDNPDLIDLEASFTGPADAEVGAEVTFRSTSQGDPGSYRWTFPDASPNFSIRADGTTTWDTPGTRTVTLEVTRGSETDTFTRQITIADPDAGGEDSEFGLNCSPSNMSTGETATCSLIGDPTDFWDLAFTSVVPDAGQATRGPSGPGSYSVSSAVEGSITVTLTGRDKSSGNDRSDSFTISVADIAPAVEPTGTIEGPNSVQVGDTTTYTVNGSFIDAYAWSGQGSPTFNSPNGQSTTVRWANPGTYQLQVVLSGAGSTTINRTVTVQAAEPTITFNPSCGPASRPADGTTAATCRLAEGNHADFTNLNWSVSNPSGLVLNQWGSPGETYVASSDAGSLTVSVSAVHTASGTPMTGGPFTITYTATTPTTPPPQPSPFGMSCSSYDVPANGSDVAWCTLDGDLENFSGLTYSIGAPNPGALNSWGDYRGYNVAYGEPGNVTVTLTGTDLATGDPVSASRTVTFSAVAPPPTDPPPPTAAPVSISCTGSTGVATIASCSVTSDPALHSGFNWSAGAPNPASLEWWPAGNAMTFRYNEAGTVGVTLTATDIATGQTVSTSTSVTFG